MATESGPIERPFADLARHTLIYGSGFVTMAVAGFVLIPVYVHELDPSEFGLLTLMLVLYGLMTNVYDLGITQSVGRFFFDDKGAQAESLPRLRATSLAFVIVYGAALTGLLVLLAGTWSELLLQDRGHADLVRIVAVTLYLEVLAIVPLTLMRMQERSGIYVAISLARFVATLGFNVLFVVVLDLGVRGVLLGNAVSALGVLLLLLPDYRHVVGARPSWDLLREMLRFGLPFFPVLLTGWVIDASDRYLLEFFRTRTEVGWYGLAYKVAQVMQIAVSAFSMGWAPLRYRIYAREDAPQIYRDLTSFSVLAVALLGVALALFAGEIVSLIAPESYEQAAGAVPLLVLAAGLYLIFLMMVTGMGVTRKTVPMAWISVAGAVLNLGLNIVVIPEWGMKGAAATTALANAVLVAGSWFYSQRVYPIPYDWSRLARIAFLAAAVVGAGAVLEPSGEAASAAWAVVWWMIYVAALLATRTLTREDLRSALQLLRRMLGRRRRVDPVTG
jgi:O-antigen/teichoic acid export membrane protein